MFSVKPLGFVVCLGAASVAHSAERQVSFNKDVMPILQQHCLECHSPAGKGEAKSGLLLDSYEHLMKGTKHGPVVMPGSSLNSVLNQVVEGRVHPSIAMPHQGEPLSEKDIKTLKDWVNQGATKN